MMKMSVAKQMRLLAGMSQEDMAEVLDIHKNTYRYKELDNDLFTLGDIKKIAEVAHADPCDFIRGSFSLPRCPQK